MNLILTSAAYHRNGVGGEPFAVALFRDKTEKRNMLAIIPDLGEDDDHNTGRCYVLDTDLLAEGNIRFTENSWRGDMYEPYLRPLIRAELDRHHEELMQRLAADKDGRNDA